MVTTMAQKFNGITVAFLMGGVNALFGVLTAFGVTLSDTEISALDAFVNFALVLGIWIAHRVGEVHATEKIAAAPAAPVSTPPPVAAVTQTPTPPAAPGA